MGRDDSSSEADRVHCRRTGQELAVQQHLTCPYCFGKKEEVSSTEHARFCDFQKGIDPIAFGFPKHAGRWKTG